MHKIVYVSTTNPEGYVVMLHDTLTMQFTPLSMPLPYLFEALVKAEDEAQARRVRFVSLH